MLTLLGIISLWGCASFQAALDYQSPTTDTAITDTSVSTDTHTPNTISTDDAFGEIIASVGLDGAEDVVIVGSVAYVAGGEKGLFLIDVYDPNLPFYLTTVGVSSAWRLSMTTAGLLVSARTDGLFIVDVSKPSTPSVTTHFDPNWSIYDATIVEDDVLVVGGSEGSGRVVRLSISAVNDLDMIVAVSDELEIGHSVIIDNDYAYIGQTHGQLSVWDLVNAQSLNKVVDVMPEKTLDDLDPLTNLAFVDGMLVGAAGRQGLVFYDVADPGRSEVVVVVTESVATDFARIGDTLVVATQSGIGLVDVTDVHDPTYLDADVNLTLLNGSDPQAIIVEQGVAFVADHGESALSLVTIQGD